jgi:hypothetical protein
MTPDDIRRTLWLPMLGEELSLATEQDRIVDEVNEALSSLAEQESEELGRLEETVADERAARESLGEELRTAMRTLSERECERESARDAQMDALAKELDASVRETEASLEKAIGARVERKTVADGKHALYGLQGSGDRLYEIETETTGAWSVARRDVNGKLYSAAPNKNKTGDSAPRQVVTLGYLEKELAQTVEPRLSAVEAAVAGKTRSYAVGDAEALEALLSGRFYFVRIRMKADLPYPTRITDMTFP